VSDRDAILARVRAGARRLAPHPGAYRAPALACDWETFADALRAAGGEPIGPVARTALATEVARLGLPHSRDARVVAVGPALPALGPGPWRALPDDVDPRTLGDVDTAILFASLGIAENGAVALDGRHAPVRALPFLCDRLVLLLEARALVPDLHAAIERMPRDATAFHHYTWISGPSKTADIEQSLVFGAHGPRACAVVGIASDR
jgi:L-lactate dehydrogenase complex protein LldG